MRTFLKMSGACVVALCFSYAGMVAAEDRVLVEFDQNKDGKTDRWYWAVDDCLTTKLLDRDYDGVPDRCDVYRIIDGTRRKVKMWLDENNDGEIDGLTINSSGIGSNGVTESWRKLRKRKLSGETPAYKYWRRDPGTNVLTIAEVSGLGVVPTDKDGSSTFSLSNLTTIPPVRVQVDENTEALVNPDGTLLTTQWKVGRDILVREEAFFKTGEPRITTIHDAKSHRKILLRRNSEGHVVLVQWEEPAGKSVMAEDANGDGQYDRFTTRHYGVIQHEAYDTDYDGLLDRVEDYPGGLAGPVTLGDQIPDRSLPKLPDLASLMR